MNLGPVFYRARWLLALAAGIGLLSTGIAVQAHRTAKAQKAAAAAAVKAQKKTAKAKDKRPAQAVVLRSGTPTLRRKLAGQEPLTVAFIGGSITQNAGAGGFVTAIPAWIKARNPARPVRVINAGIAATGSDFGAQRVERDVLDQQPDLVFVEFAVNDADRDCLADLERLVRKIRLAAPQTDIVLIYTITDHTVTLLAQGKFSPTVKQHEAVAEHYGLPTVALGFTAAARLQSGAWKWADFSPDYCHPTTAGYASYNEDFAAALPLLLESAASALPPVPPSLVPNLVVTPAPLAPVPQPSPEPLQDARGNVAVTTSELPGFGVHWTGTPEFSDATGALWRVFYQHVDPKSPVDASAGLERKDWRPQRWFAEARSFTGSTSHLLLKSIAATGNQFGASPVDAAVLTWRAPAAGHYLLHVSAASLEGGGHAPEALAGLNIVRFSSGAPRGESIAWQTTPREPGTLDLSAAATLATGDELALVFLERDFKYAFYHNFRVRIGRFALAAP